MLWNDFIGPSYRPGDYSVETQRACNWMTEKVESAKGKSPFALVRTPGRRLFCDPGLGNSAVRRMYSLNGHLYAVVGTKVIEVFSDGTCTIFDGQVKDNGKPAYIAGNITQLFVESANNGYILSNAVVTSITASGFPQGRVNGAAFLDGYFMTGVNGTQQFVVSGINDGNSWEADEISSAEARPDFILSIGVLNQEFWPFGSQTVQVFNDTADIDFPFAPRLDVAVDDGIWAPASLADVGGSWYFLAGDDRGQGMIMRMQGYSPVRVSDHGVENAIRLMANSSDAIGLAYQEKGHIFYGLQFPSANQTWYYDVSTDQWHERSYFNAGSEEAHRAYCSAACFGKILVGDRADGKIYEQSISYMNDGDDNHLIRRTRIAPCLVDQLIGVKHTNLVIDGNMGLGDSNIVDRDDPRYDPQMMLTISDDNGKNFGIERWRGFGRGGEYGRRAIWRRNGFARRRVYKSVVTAPVDWAIASCAINVKGL